MNAFERLGLKAGLMVSEEEVRDAFRKKASGSHPDTGGDEGDFVAMQVAQEVVLSPAKRLMEWLSVYGVEVDRRGQIEPGLMDLFQEVAGVGAEAEAAIKSSAQAQSALARGMAEISLMAARRKVKDLLAVIEGEMASRVSGFEETESALDFQRAARVMRDLVFLEKWKGTLKGLFGRLM